MFPSQFYVQYDACDVDQPTAVCGVVPFSSEK